MIVRLSPADDVSFQPLEGGVECRCHARALREGLSRPCLGLGYLLGLIAMLILLLLLGLMALLHAVHPQSRPASKAASQDAKQGPLPSKPPLAQASLARSKGLWPLDRPPWLSQQHSG